MDPDEVEMMRHTLSPKEFPAAVMIAQYLAEKSQTFKELTCLRQKVCRSKIYCDVYLYIFRVGIHPRAIGSSKRVEQSPTVPTDYGGKCRAFSR